MWANVGISGSYFTVTIPKIPRISKCLKSLGFVFLFVFFEKSDIIYTESEGSNTAALGTLNARGQQMKGHTMAMRRTQSNIVNLAFNITTEDGKSGVQVTQAIVNGKSAGVGLRTLNGARKSAEIKLDRAALLDLKLAVEEVLAGEEN